MNKNFVKLVNKIRLTCALIRHLATLKDVVVFVLFKITGLVHSFIPNLYSLLCTNIKTKLNLLNTALSSVSTYITITTTKYINNICYIGGLK